ncbi:hypothetical protein [Xanthobacter autotrophicus]|uniref:hypothetical protein n=1 Tax=Xanthobacter autotrophicus TaxID=280 RepID=UPI0024A65FDA|nr:hypothetical protein [Xanthobacter autotrophicus]MDI4655789.1 hypothetical protein [Xanthobacter autotrophicus]
MQLIRVSRRVALPLLAALAASPIQAQARPNTLALSCREAAALVNGSGAVVLGTGPNIYDRYVSQIRFCSGAEQLKAEWVKTRDNPQCFIGYTCYVPSRDNSLGR